MEGATSQKPVDTARLYVIGSRKQVEAALQEMYQAHDICCCKIIRRGKESIVWWPVGMAQKLAPYGKDGKEPLRRAT